MKNMVVKAASKLRALRGAVGSQRGDEPGWVLVTLMSAGLVVALWTVAGKVLVEVFNNAISKVAGMG